ncbi:MAG: TatD family hydrolase [Anaerolineae bacterium]|nr:TatD family hydrolase [Anaerolineae bacterium]
MTQALLYDTHCHLESPRFASDREDVIARARAAGVRVMVTCGTDQSTSQEAVGLAADHGDILAAVGVHPHEAQASALASQSADERSKALEALRELAHTPSVVAIGEIGLDYHYDFSPRPVQMAVLQQQLVLAAEMNLPVILHTREAEPDLRTVLDQAPDTLQGVLHCFLSDRAMATWAWTRGLYLGFGGAVTFKNAKHLQGIVAETPLDRILIETDAPYMTPYPLRGKRNEPSHVGLVAERLAQIRGCELSEIMERTFENAIRLFGPSHHGS